MCGKIKLNCSLIKLKNIRSRSKSSLQTWITHTLRYKYHYTCLSVGAFLSLSFTFIPLIRICVHFIITGSIYTIVPLPTRHISVDEAKIMNIEFSWPKWIYYCNINSQKYHFTWPSLVIYLVCISKRCVYILTDNSIGTHSSVD